MPVPQERLQHCQSSFYEQARCLFHKRGCSIVNHPFINRQDACSTREVAALSIILLSTGKMPVPQEMNFIVEQASCLLSENGAISQFLQTTQTQNYAISFNAVKFGNLRQISPPLKTKFLKQS